MTETTEELDFKTFDLVSVLSGRDYPTLERDVYFNEELGFAIYQANKSMESFVVLEDSESAKNLDEKLKTLLEEAKSQRFTVRLKSIPEATRRDIVKRVEKEHPSKTDMLGRAETNPEADEMFIKLMWAAYIQVIVDPSGAVTTVGEAEINALYDQAPESAQEVINSAIAELRNGSKVGFEQAAKGIDFLSDASPEG